MPGLYTIKVITDFSAAHVIHGYDGPCGRLHGHNWKVEAVVLGKTLNSIGICIDFKDVKKILNIRVARASAAATEQALVNAANVEQEM